jgi:hypothetical protein
LITEVDPPAMHARSEDLADAEALILIGDGTGSPVFESGGGVTATIYLMATRWGCQPIQNAIS